MTTSKEARERLDRAARRTIRCISRSCGDAEVVDAILATTDALAVLLDWHELGKRATPGQLTALLRGAEEAGRAKTFGSHYARFGWRIVPDEEGAT